MQSPRDVFTSEAALRGGQTLGKVGTGEAGGSGQGPRPLTRGPPGRRVHAVQRSHRLHPGPVFPPRQPRQHTAAGRAGGGREPGPRTAERQHRCGRGRGDPGGTQAWPGRWRRGCLPAPGPQFVPRPHLTVLSPQTNPSPRSPWRKRRARGPSPRPRHLQPVRPGGAAGCLASPASGGAATCPKLGMTVT